MQGHRSGWIRAKAALTLILLLTVIDLGTMHVGVVYQQHAMHPASYIGSDWAGTPDDSSVRFLQDRGQQAGNERMRMYPNRAGTIWENGPLVWDLESAYGYSVLWPDHYRQFHNVATANPGTTLIDIMNVRYLLLSDPIADVYPEASLGKWQLVHDGSVRVYENLNVMPRARIVHEAVYQPDDIALDWMQANTDLLRDSVVLHRAPEHDIGDVPEDRGTVVITSYENDRIVLEASMPSPGWVVLADTYYPGWKASVGDQEVEILRANYAFRAVWIESGEHRITMSYSPESLRNGIGISIGALLILLGLIGYGIARDRTAALSRSQ